MRSLRPFRERPSPDPGGDQGVKKMNLAHATMGLCLAGVVVSAKAELAPNCANAATGVALASPALHEPKTAVACDTGSGIAAAREAAQLRLYDAPRDTRASLSSTPRMDAADV